jgi:hypothetical protein
MSNCGEYGDHVVFLHGRKISRKADGNKMAIEGTHFAPSIFFVAGGQGRATALSHPTKHTVSFRIISMVEF